MRRVLAVCVLAFSGCVSQEIVSREYYEPTEATLQTRPDGCKHGALKSETMKSGSPDWSGNKSFSLLSM